jgi:hypothetical protein
LYHKNDKEEKPSKTFAGRQHSNSNERHENANELPGSYFTPKALWKHTLEPEAVTLFHLGIFIRRSVHFILKSASFIQNNFCRRHHHRTFAP